MIHSIKQSFDGPIFIVGRPRSGTKLLRSLLNNHSKISIPFWESNFIPAYAKEAKRYGNLEIYENFTRFFNFVRRIEFFRKIREHPDYSEIVNCKRWYSSIENFSYSGAIEAFFKLYAQRDNKCIWGDKSPHYMIYIKTLHNLFPKAKFIHIIRDVRDHCLSNMKTWKKSPYRAAQQWVDEINRCRDDAKKFLKNNYCEIRYESLLDDPKNKIRHICEFLNIMFENSMLELKSPAENISRTKFSKNIVCSNRGMWRENFKKDEIKKIEMISFNLLKKLKYEISLAEEHKALSKLEDSVSRISDAANRFIFDCKFQRGIFKALLYQYKKRRYG